MELKEIEKLQELLMQQQELLEKEKEKIFKQKYQGKVVLGFKLSMEENNGNWRAFKRIEGKNHVPHVGKDPRKAEKMIRKYIEKKGLN